MKTLFNKIKEMNLKCAIKMNNLKQPKGITTIETILVIAVIVVGCVVAAIALPDGIGTAIEKVWEKIMDLIDP